MMDERRKVVLPLFFWDLQFFAEERRKPGRGDAAKETGSAEKGQVPRSMEFNPGPGCPGGLLVVMNISGEYFIRNLYRFLLESFRPET